PRGRRPLDHRRRLPHRARRHHRHGGAHSLYRSGRGGYPGHSRRARAVADEGADRARALLLPAGVRGTRADAEHHGAADVDPADARHRGDRDRRRTGWRARHHRRDSNRGRGACACARGSRARVPARDWSRLTMAIACPDCGTIQTVPVLSLGDAAICPTCDHHLERTAGRSMVAAFSCAFSVFILLFPANLLPLMSVTMLSVRHTSHLASGVGMLWNTHWVVIAALVGMFAVVLPFIRFGLLSLVLGCVLTRYRPAWLGWGFRWTLALDAWAMPDVFLIGCAVGYSRVRANLPVTIEWGGICFIAAALLSMLSRASLDRRTAWRTIAPERQLDEQVPAISCTICDLVVPADAEGTPCSRCGQTLGARKPDTLIRTTALVIAGAALYIPANIFPMSTALQLGQLVPHRIIDGVRELISAGLWPLAILITCTS